MCMEPTIYSMSTSDYFLLIPSPMTTGKRQCAARRVDTRCWAALAAAQTPNPVHVLLICLVARSVINVGSSATLGVAAASAPPPHSQNETSDTLAGTASRLTMFVDKLPRMRVVRGYVRTPNATTGFSPAHLTIGMYLKKWRFHRDLAPSRVFAYGTSRSKASVPGPTIEAMAGVKTYVRWENQLPDRHILAVDLTLGGSGPNSSDAGVPTVVHLHGGATEPGSDGNALAWFTRGFALRGPRWTKPVYEYANVPETSSLWYHDHADAFTRLNLLAGLVGAYTVVRPQLEHDTWKLPRGEFEAVLLIQDRAFTKDGQIYMNATGNNPDIHPQWQPEYFGDVIVVNGKAWPYMKVQRRKYRFRIINASNARFYRLALDDPGLRFVQIGADSFYLERPIAAAELLLAPSEIVDVIVDFAASSGNAAVLTNSAPYPFPDGDPANDLNGRVMKFVIGDRVVSDGTARIPGRLANVTSLAAAVRIPSNASSNSSAASNPDGNYRVNASRDIILWEFDTADGEPTHLLINFRRFGEPATETPRIGSIEMWRVINLTPDNHPLHVHLTGFQVLHERKLNESSLDGLLDCVATHQSVKGCNLESYFDAEVEPQAPPPNEAGFKNVYKMKPYYVTSILLRFALADGRPYPFDATGEPGYAYHCHILDHEDNAMMRPYRITRE